MDRRSFIKLSSLATGSLMVPGFLRAFQQIAPADLKGYRRLIVLQLSGGNDSLSTVVPYTSDVYLKARRQTVVGASELLKINDTIGFHPALKTLRSFYDNAELSVLNGVGYPNPDRSHFRSLDIWHTASSSDEYLSTGWLGRYLDHHCTAPHQALELDDSLSLALKGEQMNGMAVTEVPLLYTLTREPFFESLTEAMPDTGQSLQYLYKTVAETYTSAGVLKEVRGKTEATGAYPQNAFGKHLRQLASLIVSGLDSRVYYISLSGFDTHVNQRNQHDRLMEHVDEALGALVQDLKKADMFKDTAILVFSEFGRRVEENASGGTDHGAAGTSFIIGGGIRKPGIFSPVPDLADLDEEGDVRFSVDFRDIYASLLQEWLQADAGTVLKDRKLLGLF